MLDTGLIFTLVVILDLSQLLWSIYGLIVKDAIEFKGKLKRWNVNVQLGIDRILAIEVKF